RGKRVLLAEDNPLNQMLTVAMVEALGAECIVVSNGQEALERVAAGGLDVVLMDVQMPVMGGLEATEAIRRHEAATPGAPRLPIIAMTAHAMQDDRARCLAAGMDGYLAKPVGLQALAEALADALRLRQP
ncbi:response regulator, partial [Escherichia coli]|nr:response regulator [Escherichia coli]